MHAARVILLILGLVAFLFSLVPLAFATLGFVGALADTGPADNREMGLTLLKVGLPLALLGLVLVACALVRFRKSASLSREVEVPRRVSPPTCPPSKSV